MNMVSEPNNANINKINNNNYLLKMNHSLRHEEG